MKKENQQMELIEERRASWAYKNGNRYRKYFKYATIEQAEYEYRMQKAFLEVGIKTPECYGFGVDDIFEKPYIECEYKHFKKIQVETVILPSVKSKVLALLDKISSVSAEELKMEIDNEIYYNDLSSALSYIDDGVDWKKSLIWLRNTKRKVLCHGDFSLDNLALDENGEVFLFDYQHVFLGVKGWDLAYMVASLPWRVGAEFLNGYMYDTALIRKIRLSAAIKYGRGLRKQDDLKQRTENYRYWKGRC